MKGISIFKKIILHITQILFGNTLRAKLVRDGIAITLIRIGEQIVRFGLGIALARGLGAEGYGIYAYALALMNVLVVVGKAGVPLLLMREISARYACEEWSLLRGWLIWAIQVVSFASIVVSLTGFLVLSIINSLNSTKFVTLSLMLVLLPLSALNETVSHALYGLRRIVEGQFITQLFRPLLFLFLIGVLFYFYPNIRTPYFAMGLQIVVNLFILLVSIWILFKYLPNEVKKSSAEYKTWEWLKKTLPFIMIGGTLVINSQIDTIVLGWFVSSGDIGIYRVAVQVAGVVNLGLLMIGVVVAPHFASLYAQKDLEKLQKLITLSSRVAFTAALLWTVIFIFWGESILTWVFGEEFKAGETPLVILAFGYLINVFFGPVGYLLNMTGYERYVSKVLGQTCILNLILNILLIPLLGINGAAITTAFISGLLVYRLSKFAYQRLGLDTAVFSLQKWIA